MPILDNFVVKLLVNLKPNAGIMPTITRIKCNKDSDEMKSFRPEIKSAKPLYQQLAYYILSLIEKGDYQSGEKLSTVNEAYRELQVARDTVISAYKFLQEKGKVYSVPGKGFFVAKNQENEAKRLFILFDAINQYKETLYRSLLGALGNEFYCDTSFHYYDKELFERQINYALGKYDAYIIIPHFNVDVTPILRKIPEKQLLLLDGMPRNYDRPCSAVYQDFHKDLYEEMMTLHEKLMHYEALHVVFNDSFQFIPYEFLSGIYQFSGETHYPVHIERGFDMERITKKHCYMAISERDLACITKVISKRGWKLKEDIGLLSFDDTPLKEVLSGGITTISTDFEQMGHTAGQLIRKGIIRRIANPWVLMDRGSL